MNDSMSEMLLVGLSQSEWELLMQFIAKSMTGYEEFKDEEGEMHYIIKKLTNQIY
jgi:D-Tyr-tRNAtyr deacylase